jgi:hypothetical protein
MAVEMCMVFFWVVMLCELVGRYQSFGGFMNEDGGSEFLQNDGAHLHVHMASEPRRPPQTSFQVFF